jgi:hypothetical protein
LRSTELNGLRCGLFIKIKGTGGTHTDAKRAIIAQRWR